MSSASQQDLQQKQPPGDAFGDIRTMIDKYRKEREVAKDKKNQL